MSDDMLFTLEFDPRDNPNVLTLTIGKTKTVIHKVSGYRARGVGDRVIHDQIDYWRSDERVVRADVPYEEVIKQHVQGGWYPDGEGGWQTERPYWWNKELDERYR